MFLVNANGLIVCTGNILKDKKGEYSEGNLVFCEDNLSLFDIEVPGNISVGDKYVNREFIKTVPTVIGDVDMTLLTEAKYNKIVKSNTDLAGYLTSHPLKSSCHKGIEESYTATFEKQTLFSNNFSSHIVLTQAGLTDVMTWNATGKPCEVWTDPECIQFMAEMKAYVKPLVAYQQHLEIQVNACTTLEEVETIEIDYSKAS